MAKKLTPKQAVFVKGVVDGKPAYKAALAAYDTESLEVANAIAVENLQKPSIQQAVQNAMEKQGLTIDLVVKPIVDGLTAKKYMGEGSPIEVPDHSTRLKASGMALDLMGAKQKNDTNISINFNQHMAEQKDKYGL